ncbi:hypothetical protein [Xylanimonas sp. McL0601]|uniref:hypothetical protein n=1 Tax=Xylanimonas sp. McL0601 TaxID=3414739 RepID=UPI003CED8D6C
MNEITITELEGESMELLPDRETLFFNHNWATVVASNSSLALNAASLFASANSTALQYISVSQH